VEHLVALQLTGRQDHRRAALAQRLGLASDDAVDFRLIEHRRDMSFVTRLREVRALAGSALRFAAVSRAIGNRWLRRS
jgi:hypothetical protein